ncbi:MAG: glycosyltransferase [Lachnospiraceae bacterium]|nr:glycosyltransferase [Lachnospiraceae bacterium]
MHTAHAEKMIVTYHGDVETTSFFMTQIEKGLRADGYEVCPLFFNEDLGAWLAGKEEKLKEAFFLTFNFAGIYSKDACRMPAAEASDSVKTMDRGKNADGVNASIRAKAPLLVDKYMMRCVNILVDHPYHYHDFLYEQIRIRRARYLQFCIDRQHIAYMKRYFPEIDLGGFLPSGGTAWETALLSGGLPQGRNTPADNNSQPPEGVLKKEDVPGSIYNASRPIDILFPATYVEPECFNVFIDRNGPEYTAFYHSIIDEALANPKAKLEDIVKRRMEEEIEEGFTEDELRLTLGHIQFLDYYIRYTRRAQVVRWLVDGNNKSQTDVFDESSSKTDAGDRIPDKASFHLTIVGSGWDNFIKTLKHPERVTLLPYADSEEVLRMMTKSKLVLNVLPSFHEGAHDRIFNAMLNGAVCITDSNDYLDELLRDGENAVLYDIVDETPDKTKDAAVPNIANLHETVLHLLSAENEENRSRIAEASLAFAKNHTWLKRVEILEKGISD